MDFAAKHCVPCEGGVEPLTRAKAAEYLTAVPGWSLSADGMFISREFILKDFAGALALVNAVAKVAELEGHHPDMNIHGWNKVTITLSTHAIKGLSDNDFILAAKVNQVASG